MMIDGSLTAAAVANVPPEIQAVVDVIQPLFVKLSYLVGGLFGLYVILIMIRTYYERKKVKLLQNILYDLDKMNMHYGLGYSKTKRGIIRKTIGVIRSWFSEKKSNNELNKSKKEKINNNNKSKEKKKRKKKGKKK